MGSTIVLFNGLRPNPEACGGLPVAQQTTPLFALTLRGPSGGHCSGLPRKEVGQTECYCLEPTPPPRLPPTPTTFPDVYLSPTLPPTLPLYHPHLWYSK